MYRKGQFPFTMTHWIAIEEFKDISIVKDYIINLTVKLYKIQLCGEFYVNKVEVLNKLENKTDDISNF